MALVSNLYQDIPKRVAAECEISTGIHLLQQMRINPNQNLASLNHNLKIKSADRCTTLVYPTAVTLQFFLRETR
jgi:hypothetical protein